MKKCLSPVAGVTVTKLFISCLIPMIVKSPDNDTFLLNVQLLLNLYVPEVCGELQSNSTKLSVDGVVCVATALAE